jgi:hypothetical protein
MTTPAPDSPLALDLSREERWVAHHAVLARVERDIDADNDPSEARDLLVKLEDDDSDYDADELRLMRDCLEAYLTDAPDCDVDPGRSALDSVELALD